MGEQDLGLPVGIGEGHFEGKQEAVELGLGKRKGSGGVGVVLRGDDHERLRQVAGDAIDGDLALVHAFQECGLHAGGGAVDLIGKQAVCKNRARDELELAFRGAVEVVAEQIGGEQVRGELHPLEAAAHGGGEGVGEGGFADAGCALDEDMAVREECSEQHAGGLFGTDDGFCEVPEKGLEGVGFHKGSLREYSAIISG